MRALLHLTRILCTALLAVCCAPWMRGNGQTSYHIGAENGLKDNALTILIRDHLGYMWFGSYNCLYQHQGSYIKRYARVGQDSLSLSGSEMHALFEDRAGTIWVGTTAGLDRLNPATGVIRHYRLYAPDSSRNLGYIYSIFEDREQFIWVAADASLFRIDPVSGRYEMHFIEKDAHSIPSTATGYHQGLGDRNGFLISTAYGPAYYSYRSHSFTHRYNSSEPFYSLERGCGGAGSDLCADDSGRIYFVSNGSTLVRFHPGTGMADTFNFSRPAGAWACCYSLARDYRGGVWIGFRNGGILVFDPARRTFTPIRQEARSRLIQSNYISSLCEDYQHHMWVTTDEGIDVIDYYGKGLQLFQLSDAPDFRRLIHGSGIMSYDGRSKLTIAFGGGIRFAFSTDSDRITTDTIPPARQGSSYRAALLPDGLRHNPQETGEERLRLLTAPDRFHRKRDAVWAYESGGIRYEKYGDGQLVRVEKDGSWRTLVADGYMKQACVSRDGSILYFLNDHFDIVRQQIVSGRTDTLRFKDAVAKAGFSFANTRDITDDGAGHLWITSQNGLVRYDLAGGNVKSFTTANGLSENFTYSLVTDGAGVVWVGSMGGVDWYDATAGAFRNAIRFRDATYMDAFGSSLKTADGTLYFNAGNKLLRIRPDEYLHRADILPKLLIHEVTVNGRQVGGTQDPFLQQLSRHDNRLQFRYGLLDYTGSHSDIRVQYRLLGLETEWTDDEHHEASYTALPPGRYRFQVRALAPDGRTELESVSAPFAIHPAFWQTWWARGLALLLIITVVTLLVRRRIAAIRLKASLQQQMSELESRALRAQMNPHFLFNSLNAIQELVIREDTTAAYQYLSKFSKLLRMVLQHAEHSSISLADELAMYDLYLALEDLRFNHTFCYLIRIDEPLDVETVRIPPLLLQPYLENAIWHGLMHRSGDKVLDIHFSEQGSNIVCTITDNGIGREAAAQLRKSKIRPQGHTSKGMSLSEQRIALLNKTRGGAGVAIHDLVDEQGRPAGTQVVVTLATDEEEF